MSASPNQNTLGALVARVEMLEESFDRIEPRLRVVETETTKHGSSVKRTEDHELRIRSLESRDKWLAGAVAALAFVGSLLAPLVKHWVTGG